MGSRNETYCVEKQFSHYKKKAIWIKQTCQFPLLTRTEEAPLP